MKTKLFFKTFTIVIFTMMIIAQSSNGDEMPDFTIQNSVKTFEVKGVSFDMVYVDGGSFMMGATSEQGSDAEDNEKPAHKVILSDYYIGKYEVTQQLWRAVMGMQNNPSYHKGDNYPVEGVSWKDVQRFLTKLNNLTGKVFILPTEAQWEFAARGGNKSLGYKYSGSNNLNDVGWYDDNNRYQTHIVGQKQPNELGLYDMSGNVYEWCSDQYDEQYYSASLQTDPQGPSFSPYGSRVVRGGDIWINTKNCRVTYRGNNSPGTRDLNGGFRLAMVP